jgi:glycosyltransferase involved in cell wall biosynthesis
MKLLRVIATIDPKTGGPIEGLKRASLIMSEMEVQVEIACLDAPGDLADEVAALPWKVHSLGPHKLGHYAYAPRFKEWLAAHVGNYDAVIIHGMWQYHGFATARACKKLGVPYFVYTHGMLDPWFNRTYPLKKLKKQLYWFWGEHPVLSNASAVLFTSEEECRLARQSFSPYKVNEKVIGYGTTAPDLDIETIVPRFRAHAGAWGARPYFVFLGRIQEKKGLDLLVAAYSKLRQTNPDIPDLVIVGPQQQPAYATRIQADSPQDGIFWVDALEGEKKWEVLAAAEALALVSHQENFGLVVAEALAVGTPVLISDKVNIWREISEGGAGFIQPDTREGARKLLMSWLSLDQAQKANMADQAKAVYHEHFEIRKATELLIAYIEATLKP